MSELNERCLEGNDTYNLENRSLNNNDIMDYFRINKTDIYIDLFGPIIDISCIPDFHGVNSIRYLSEKDIANLLNQRYPRKEGWRPEDILNRTLEILENSKIKMQLIDTKVLEQICRAKKFCNITIVSSVPKEELFFAARDLLIKYSESFKCFRKPYIDYAYSTLDENDFKYVVKGIEEAGDAVSYCLLESDKKNKEKGLKPNTTIVFDDDIPRQAFVSSQDTNRKIKWISGVSCVNCFERLKKELDARSKINSTVESLISFKNNSNSNGSHVIDLENYQIENLKGFYIYEKPLREELAITIEAIKSILKLKDSENEPVCIFLAGAPGTGKSYFVRLFAENMNARPNYPYMSLSGVGENEFTSAIDNHIERVYNESVGKDVSIAFLDEVDTKGGYYGFRFLMDPMTGTFTDKKGKVVKENKVSKLVWFFAGSAGLTRKEFIKKIVDDERKVIDFFDRIHFDIKLPTVDVPGQAILTFLSNIKRLINNKQKEVDIDLDILFLFGCTMWNSARSIYTICKIAVSKEEFNHEKVEFEIFKDIRVASNFNSVYKKIEHERCDESKRNQYIKIKW